MTVYFLVIISVWSVATSGGTIEHVDSKKIGVFQEREQCIAAKDAITLGLENGVEAHCIRYLLKEQGSQEPT